MKVLAGDIGGTKTLLQVAEVRGNEVEVLHRARFPSQNHADFDSLLHAYLDQIPTAVAKDITSACFGVAGPIRALAQGSRQASVTNLPWQLDEAQLQSLLHLPRVHLINDFFAVACGIEALPAEDLAVLHPGTAQHHAPRLVVGAGTGLGVAQLFWCDGHYRAHASEGGHIHFAPTDSLQIELLAYMKGFYDRVSYERLVSGGGIIHIYTFLAQRDQKISAAKLEAVMDNPDPAAAIANLARGGDVLAGQSVSLFLAIYGAVVADLALVNLPYGGVYIAGGIAPKLLLEMQSGAFMTAYARKGRMSSLVEKMPVYIVMNEDVGLLGATLVPALF
jgi:glucokinase